MRPRTSPAAVVAGAALASTAFTAPASADPDRAFLVIGNVTDVTCFVRVKGHAHVGATQPKNITDVRLFSSDVKELLREGPFSTVETGDYTTLFRPACARLNPQDGPDDIHAIVTVFDPSTGRPFKIISNTVTVDF
ncbi:hypothetical protein [Nonomuraea typhae]|uniref:Uncharacterized protein n=1 Tax=Nonomuraea typhae TaxID=2603600 RepID=A0ABW7YYL0_9ACTN